MGVALKAKAAALGCLCLLLVSGCGGSGESSTSTSTTTEQRTGGERSIEGFGSEAKGAEKQAMLDAYRSYLGAIGEKDYPSACGLLSEQVKDSLAKLSKGKASCEEVLPSILSPTAAPLSRAQARGEVTKVRVEGENGFLVFRAPGAKLYQLTLLSEGREWRVASLGAAVLVPDL
jgi:hypothetical protein